MKPDTENTDYLGDGVYVKVNDFYQLVLMTGSHNCPDNTIYLETEVFAALLRYVNRVGFENVVTL